MQQEQNGTLEKKTRDFQVILRRERSEHGWTQADVAQKIGSDTKTVGRWERGVTFPSPYMCQQLSALYGKSVQELRLVRDEPLPDVGVSTVRENERSTQELRLVQDATLPDVGVSTAPENEHRAAPAPEMEVRILPQKRESGRRMFFYLSSLIVFLLLITIGMRWPLYRGVATQAVIPKPSNPYAGKGTLVLNEPLLANSALGWSLNQNDQGQCFFADRQYRIRDIQRGVMEVCLANETYFTNFTYEVSMTIEAGDCGGLAFRTTFPQLYYFLSCFDGHYRFVRYDKDNPAKIRIVASGISPAIHLGLNATNVLAVVAVGDTFKLYVNHTLIVSNIDGAYLDGQVGVIAHTCRDSKANLCDAPTEVAFNNARLWQM